MQFKGQLLLPGESGPGLKVNLDVAEHHLAVESDGGGLGAWPLEAVEVERLHGDHFTLTVAGEALRFVADDTIAFTYSAVPAIEQTARRSGVRSMIGRLWKGNDRPDQPAVTAALPVEEQPSVDEPSPMWEALESEATASWVQMPVHDEALIDDPVEEDLGRVPRRPAPEATRADEPWTEAAQCPAVRSDGQRCESQILTESGFCYPHDPRRAFEDGYQAAQEARAQLKKDATVRLNRIYGRLEKAMRQVERGELDPETAMAMAQLARTMCAILEMDEPATEDGWKPPQT